MIRHFSTAILIGILAVAVTSGANSRVTVLAVDAFGRPLTGCRIESFRISDDRLPKPHEFANHFRGLVGLGIPYGEYEGFLRCKEGSLHTYVVVDDTNKFAVAALNEDLIVGERGNPKLAISLDGPLAEGEVWWVRLVGLYKARSYAGDFSGPRSEAVVDAPNAGSYLVTVLSTGGYECIKQVDLFEQTRRWKFHTSNCKFDLDRYANLVELPVSGNHWNTGWYREMQKEREAFFRSLQEASQKK